MNTTKQTTRTEEAAMNNTEKFIMDIFRNRNSISPQSGGFQAACERLRKSGLVARAGWVSETRMNERRRRYSITGAGRAVLAEHDR